MAAKQQNNFQSLSLQPEMITINLLPKAQRYTAHWLFQPLKSQRQMRNLIFLFFAAQRNFRNKLFNSIEA